jgi:hypothetical protein
MKKKLFILVALCVICSAAANAAAYLYEGNGAWENASITEGWTLDGGITHPGVLPGAADEARLNWGGAEVTASIPVPAVWRVYVGCDESATLTVHNGGVVSMTDCLMMAVGGNPNTGILNVEAGGTVSTTTGGGHLWAAENPASTAILNISGTLNIGGILGLGSVGFGNGGAGYLNVLNKGVVHLTNIHGDLVNLPSIKGSSRLDITGGLVTLPGDFEAVVRAYVDAGKITADGGIGIVGVVFSGGQTLVTPEPITLSLLGLGALLLRRR